MQFETKKQSFMGRWSGSAAVACLALMLGFASTGYGDIIIGDWESTMDGWQVCDSNFVATPGMTPGATLHNYSLGVTTDTINGWRQFIHKSWGGWSQLTPFQNATTVSVDVTMIASEWTLSPDNNDGIKPMDNLIVMGPSNWWEQISPVTYPDFNSDANRAGYWKPEDGDKTVTYTFNLAARGSDTYVDVIFITNIWSCDVNGRIYFDNARIVTSPFLTVSKCTVAAGKTQYTGDSDFNDMKDAFTASGTFAPPADINDVNSVGVTIISKTNDYLVYTEDLNDFNATVVNSKGKYTHTGKLVKGQEGKVTSLTLDFRKGTFAVTAKNIDLTGLASPIELKFTLDVNELVGSIDESVINGPKNTIPTRLMRMYKDTLVVPAGKTKVKSSTKASSDSLSVTGEIAVEDINTTDPNLYALPVVITWSDVNDVNVQTFTIEPHSFKIPKTGHSYKLGKNITPTVAPVAEPNAKVSGTIDLDSCTFALSITKADLNTVSGEAKFGIAFGDFNEVNDVNLAWKK